MGPIATGQITLIDINDARSVTGYIGSNQAKVQIFNPNGNTYTPNWTTTNMILTPSLFVSGTATDIIGQAKSITWYEQGNNTPIANDTNYSIGTGAGKPLTIKTNILASKNQQVYLCEVVWTDPTTGLDIISKLDIELVKVTNGTNGTNGSNGANGQNAIAAYVWAPNGNIFRNSAGSLIAECDVFNGSTQQTTGVTYQWYKQDASVSTDQGGGIGWLKLTATATGGGTSGHTTDKLTIPAGAVAGMASFKCIATYSSKTYVDVVTFADQTDPLQVTPIALTGNVFKNGQGTVQVIAKVYQAGAEVDAAGTKYQYRWYLYNAGGTMVPNWGGTTNYKTGKTLTVQASEITGKGTVICEIE